jgi:DNA-directed RNA polymerase specialized sigma24 family protein
MQEVESTRRRRFLAGIGAGIVAVGVGTTQAVAQTDEVTVTLNNVGSSAWEVTSVDGDDSVEQARLALAEMPDTLRQVIVLRDVGGQAPDEVSEALGLTPEDERAMLHQARGIVRARLERYFEGRGNDGGP